MDLGKVLGALMSYWKGKKVLVPGGAGFLGSHTVDLLLNKGAIVTVVDNLERGSLENLSKVQKDIRFIRGDVRIASLCDRVVKGHDLVLNFAAKVAGVTYNCGHHSQALTDNLLISSNLIRASANRGVERFLVLSSSAVYPYGCPLPMSEAEADQRTFGPAEEGYSWSKYIAELQARFYALETSIKVGIVRPFNVYGPRDPADGVKAHVIPAIIRRLLDREKQLVLAGSGDQSRAFLYVSDCAQATLDVLELYPKCDAVNIGSTRGINLRKLVHMILKIFGSKPEVVYDRNAPEGHPHKLPDISKFKLIAGSIPERIPLERGLEKTIAWHRHLRRR